MPTKFYTYRCKCFCIMLFVGIILYAALKTDFEIEPVRKIVKTSAAVYPSNIAICMIISSPPALSLTIIFWNSVLKMPSATMMKNP